MRILTYESHMHWTWFLKRSRSHSTIYNDLREASSLKSVGKTGLWAECVAQGREHLPKQTWGPRFNSQHCIKSALGYLRPYLMKTRPIASKTLWEPSCLSIVWFFLILSWGVLLPRSVCPLCNIPERKQFLCILGYKWTLPHLFTFFFFSFFKTGFLYYTYIIYTYILELTL